MTVAKALNGRSFGTLLFDLLSPEEEADRANVFDIALLAGASSKPYNGLLAGLPRSAIFRSACSAPARAPLPPWWPRRGFRTGSAPLFRAEVARTLPATHLQQFR
jgi:hypothetical protein